MFVAVAIFAGAVAGLTASALHARHYRRRQRYLDAIVAVLEQAPDGTVGDIAKALNLSAFKTGSVYAELDLLERRGRVVSRWDAEAKRMHWSVKGGVR